MWIEQVQEWLTKNDRTQAWLSRKAGVSAFHLNRCLQGKENASARFLAKLEIAMGLAAGTLKLWPAEDAA